MSADLQSTRWRVLTLLGFAELLGMSLWFSASAVTPQLRSIWGLSAVEAGKVIAAALTLVAGMEPVEAEKLAALLITETRA